MKSICSYFPFHTHNASVLVCTGGCKFQLQAKDHIDETLPTIYINQSTQQKAKTRNKIEGPTTSKKTNEPPQEGESQGEHQVPKPPLVVRSISKKEMKGKDNIAPTKQGNFLFQ